MAMITNIGHTAYSVSDMDASMHFYRDLLGFQFVTLLRDDKGEPWINYLRISDSQFIELFFGGSNAAAFDSYSYHHLCLQVDDLERTVKELEVCGVKLDIAIKKGVDLNYQCWISDPDGNRIELLQLVPESPQMRSLKGGK